MTNWLTQLQQFWSVAQKTPQLAPVHEVLTRSQRFCSAYALWDKSIVIEALRQAYQKEITGEKGSAFTRIDGPTAAGLQWQKPAHLVDTEFDFWPNTSKICCFRWAMYNIKLIGGFLIGKIGWKKYIATTSKRASAAIP